MQKRHSVKINSVVIVAIGFFSFIFSIFFAPYHVSGDQEHYSAAYSAVINSNIFDAINSYRSIIFSFEPIHFLIIYLFANIGIDKNALMAVFNSALAMLFAKFLYSKTRSHFIVFLIVFTNYYIYTLFFTLEKLKFGVIFFLLLLLYRNIKFGFLSAFTHFQLSIPIIIGRVAEAFKGGIAFNRGRSLQFRTIAKALIVASFAVAVIFIFSEYIGDKLLYYTQRDEVGGIVSLIPTVIIFSFLLASSNSKHEVTVFYLLLLAAIYFIGSDRLNMISYFAFFYYAIFTNRSFFLFLFLSSAYFGYKSIEYFLMIINTGG